MRPGPDFSQLVAQYSARIRRLEFEIARSRTPFAAQQIRSLAHGALLSVTALRAVAPSHLTPLIDEAESALRRAWTTLD